MINEISTFILNKISSSMINDCLDIINNANDLRNRISARFFYDRLGRIVVSQNSRQQAQNRFSYSLYDALGRVVEAGEKTENTPGTNVLAFTEIFGAYVGGNLVPSVIDDTKLASWLNTQATNTRKEITRSYYDRTNTSILAQLPSSFTPDPLTQRKRIVHVTYETAYDSNDATYDHATHYDYDIHGNVKTLLQDNANLGALNQLASQRFKRMDYTFDLISGNVHRVDYETNKADQWHHAYSYDADNRITAVYTTSATPLVNDPLAMSSLQNEPLLNPTWEKEAAYSYYAHGPLARTVIGEQEVQGLDYMYTIQGWIKAVNSNNLDANNDPGKDGLGLSANHRVAQDVMGYSLHYFNNDYLPILNGNTTFIADQTNSDMLQNSSDLYNGNIARMVTTITDPNSRAVLPLGNAYRYDQLNRLKHAVSFDQLNGNAWAGGAPAKYENSFTYDANGNILTQTRNDDNNQVIDELAYFYPQNAANKTVRNRLLYVSDNVDYDASDIDPGMSTSNYSYDQEGRLTQDLQEEIASIEWRVDGKVKRINRIANSTKQNLSFDYDAMGHRIAKHVYTSANVLEKSTYYVLDAQGNTMATYERAVDENTLQISYAQTEKLIYGSSRLGVQNCNIALLGSQNNTYSQTTVPHRIGKKGYELSNHLGNVLSVISDKAIPHNNGGGVVDYFLADIRQAQDFSPFGVLLQNRNLSLSGANPYRYLYQGSEMDDEVSGEGNHINFTYRGYDPRIGRMWSIDPLASKYPFYTPYSFSGNRVIDCREFEGLEPIDAIDPKTKEPYFRPAFNINLPNGATATLFVHGGTYALTPQDRDLIASFPEFKTQIGDNYPPSYTAQTGNFGIYVIAGVGGVSRKTEDRFTQDLFRSTQLTGPSLVTQTINRNITTVTPNNQRVGGFQVVNQNTRQPVPLNAGNQQQQLGAVNMQFGAINTAVNGILNDPNNALTSINIPYNPNVSNGTLNALQQQTQQLQTQYPNANISLTPDNTLGTSVVTSGTSIGFNTTTTQQVQQTQTVPTMTPVGQ